MSLCYHWHCHCYVTNFAYQNCLAAAHPLTHSLNHSCMRWAYANLIVIFFLFSMVCVCGFRTLLFSFPFTFGCIRFCTRNANRMRTCVCARVKKSMPNWKTSVKSEQFLWVSIECSLEYQCDLFISARSLALSLSCSLFLSISFVFSSAIFLHQHNVCPTQWWNWKRKTIRHDLLLWYSRWIVIHTHTLTDTYPQIPSSSSFIHSSLVFWGWWHFDIKAHLYIFYTYKNIIFCVPLFLYLSLSTDCTKVWR